MWKALILAVVLTASLASAANDFSNDPWILDTAGAGVVYSGDVRVACIKWVGATTVGHQAILQDGNSKVVWEELSPGSNFVTSECKGSGYLFRGGVRLTTLGSGKVYLYVK